MEVPQMDIKKQRKANFSDLEVEVLVDAVSTNYRVLYGKFSPCLTNSMKTEAWEAVTDKVNAVSVQCRREMTDIKKKWQDLQSFVKKKESQRRKSVRQTGGGPMQISSLKPWEEKILQTIPQTSICGIEDGVDTSTTCTSSNMSQGTSTQVHVSQGGQDRCVEAVPSVIITEVPAKELVNSFNDGPVFSLDSQVSTGTDSSLLSQEESCLLTAPSPRHSRGTASSRNSGNVLSGKRRAQLCEYSTETQRLVEIEEEKLAIKKKRLEIEQEKLQILRNVYSLLQEKSTSSVPSFSRLLSEF